MVYPACGSSNSAIALTPDELAAIVPKSEWVDVCKLPEWRHAACFDWTFPRGQ